MPTQRPRERPVSQITRFAPLTAANYSAELTDEEQVAQQFTLRLSPAHTIDDELYQAAASRFGEKGLIDMIILAGCYHLICSLLKVFAVPAPEPSRPFEGEA